MDADLLQYLKDMEARIMAAIGKPVVPPTPVSSTGPTLLNLSNIPNDGHGQPDWSLATDLIGGVRYFNKDFWIRGFPGAQKGVDLNLWGGAATGMAMMGGAYDGYEHLYVVTLQNPQPDRGAWLNAVKSVADLGWMPWVNFVPSDTETGGQAQARWTVAGRPSVDKDGYIVDGGKYAFNQAGQRLKKGDDAGFKVG